VDVTSGAVVRIEVGSQPDGVALDLAKQRLYVANFSDGTLSLIDVRSWRQIRRVQLGPTPSYLVFDPVSGHVFVTLHLAHQVIELDGEGNSVREWDLQGRGPYGITLDETGRRLFTANRLDNSISRLNLQTGQQTRLSMPCSTRLVAFNSNTQRLWALCDVSRTLYVLDANSGAILYSFSTGREPGEGLAINPVTNRVYLSNAGDDTVSIFQENGPVATPPPLPTATPTPTPTRTPSPTPAPTATHTPTPRFSPTPTCVPSPDRYEPDDTPAHASFFSGGVQKHNFDRDDDVDWVRFQASANLYYDIATYLSSDIDVDTFLAIYSNDGLIQLASNDNADPSTLASALVFHPKLSAPYLIRVSNNKGIGSCFTYYTLHLAIATPTATATPWPYRFYMPLVVQNQASLQSQQQSYPSRQRPQEPVPAAIAVRPSDGLIALARAGFLIIMQADGQQQHRIPIGTQPVALLFDEDGSLLLSEAVPARISRYNADTGTLQGQKTVRGRPAAIVRAGDLLYVSDPASDRILALDAHLNIQQTFDVGPGPYAMANYGDLLAVAYAGGDSIGLIPSQQPQEARTITLGGLGHPQDLVFSADGNRLYVIFLYTPNLHRVAEIDVDRGQVLRLIGGDLKHRLQGVFSLALQENTLLLPDSAGLQRFDLVENRWLTPLPGLNSTLPFGLAQTPQGDLLVAPLLPHGEVFRKVEVGSKE